MNCRQVIQLLPLWIGHDLADAADGEAIRSHLSKCPACKAHRQQLQESLDALQSISTLASGGGTSRGSLWPRLSVALKEMPRRRDHFNGWIPASAMALAASLMVAVSVMQVRQDFSDSASISRNLFQTDQRFLRDARDQRSGLQVPVVARPVNYPTPNF